MTIKEGDWVEGDNGYGVILRIFPRYYQYGDEDIPNGKSIGDKKQNSIVLKRFCSFDFKVRMQTRLILERLASKIGESEMKKINDLLRDENVSKKFVNYKPDEIDEVGDYNQKLTKEKITRIQKGLENLDNNGHLNLTLKEIESFLKKNFDIELYEKPMNSNCYIQLISDGLGVYRNKEKIFKKIRILQKSV